MLVAFGESIVSRTLYYKQYLNPKDEDRPHTTSLGSIARRENIIRLAVDAEAEGFDSLWVAERLLWPLNPQTPYQPTSDGSLPTFIKMYSIL
jgi:alkanesulfonate monooxygenase SsuD/methylene tetrahydromethanopterin reductase-like flavin-dependent oxidoreductase (luciferase family)